VVLEYNWIDPAAESYRSLAFNRLLAFESREVAPEYVIEGVEAQSFDDVPSGITLGWLNLNNALTFQAAVGSGHALITTFRFSQYGQDRYTKHLLDSYLQCLSSANCRPQTQWLASGIMPSG
jgi:hypothetical protein